MHPSRLVAVGTLALVALAGCAWDGSGPPTGSSSSLRVAVASTGFSLAPGGYRVVVTGQEEKPVGTTGEVVYADTRAAAVQVRLSGVPDNCKVAGDTVRSVELKKGRDTRVDFQAVCARVVVYVQDDNEGNGTCLMGVSEGSRIPRRFLGPEFRSNSPPSWSPDGKRLAVSYNTGSTHEIGVGNWDGTGIRTIAPAQGAHSRQPRWSPDGSQIAFVSDRHDVPVSRGMSVYIMNADGSGVRRLTAHPENSYVFSFSWSPDGQEIWYVLYSFPARTQQLYAVTVAGQVRAISVPGHPLIGSVDWAPDGTRIAFASTASGTSQIYTMLPGGGGIVQLTHAVGDAYNPVWSPDAQRIAFISNRNGEWTNSDINTMRADGTDERRVSDGIGRKSDPAWRP